ncbi:hypothetical protein ACROYT_G015429 [Oculina patagonica]
MASGQNANEDSGGSSSTDENRKTEADILVKVQSLFGEAIYEALQKEEINNSELIADLAAREADAPIFTKLGFTYGKAVRFKKEFQIARVQVRPSSPASPAYKPTMADMSSMSPEMRQLYLSKRKKIGLLATQRWGDSLPKFNSPETKKQLTEFATGITPDCGIPEINFNSDGIARHIQNFFSEQRRYRKNKTTSCKYSSGEFSASGSSSASGAESSPQSEGGDTEPVDDEDDNDDSSISESPPCSQVPSVVASEGKSAWPLAVNQAIVKGVFSRVLNRDDIVHVLKKKFSVQPRSLTNLKPTELMSVLAKKLVRSDYCRVKEVVKNVKEDITVLKEIAF